MLLKAKTYVRVCRKGFKIVNVLSIAVWPNMFVALASVPRDGLIF
jgi:hypothetical protein